MKTTHSTSRSTRGLAILLAGFVALACGAQAQSPEQAKNRMIETLQAADTNKDGMLTKAELSTSLEEGFRRMDRNGNGLVNAGDAPRLARDTYMSRVAPIISERDANADGNLSYAEFSKRPLDNFAAGDADGDGQVELSVLINAIRSSSSQ